MTTQTDTTAGHGIDNVVSQPAGPHIVVLTRPHRPHTSPFDTQGRRVAPFLGTSVCLDPMEGADYDDPARFRHVPTIGTWDPEAVNNLGTRGAGVDLPNWPEIRRTVAALRAIHGPLPVVIHRG